jgi:hypothetical protein
LGAVVTLSKLVDELESSVTPAATSFGSIVGVAVVLAAVTAAIIFIGKWAHWAGLLLSLGVLFGTVFTVVEVVGALGLRREAEVTVSTGSVRYAILVKAVELLLFVCAVICLYVFLI